MLLAYLPSLLICLFSAISVPGMVVFYFERLYQDYREQNKVSLYLDSLKIAGSNKKECGCPICYTDFNKDSAVLLPCNHAFHKACLLQWLQTKFSCPICRNELKS